MTSDHYLFRLFESLTTIFICESQVCQIFIIFFHIHKYVCPSIFSVSKMKLFALFLFFSLVTAGQKNNQKRQKRKLSRKEFRKCKSENCSDSCQAGQLKTPACISCIQSACDLPKGLALSIECMQMTCADNCTEDMYRYVYIFLMTVL